MSQVLIAVLWAFVKHMLGNLITEKYVAQFFFYAGHQIAKSTANNMDDEAVNKLEEIYNSGSATSNAGNTEPTVGA